MASPRTSGPRILTVAVVLGAAGPAWSGPADLTGLSAEQLATGAPIAIAADAAGAITGNPAQLAAVGDGVTVGLVGSHAGALVRLAPRPPGFDVGASIYGARTEDGSPLGALATADLPTRLDHTDLADEALLVVSDARALGRRLTLGLLAAVPVTSGIAPSTFYADEREAAFSNQVHLALLEDDRKASVLAAGLAARLSARVRLGLGAQLIIGAAPTTRVYLPSALAPSVSDTNTTLGVAPTVMPTVGVSADLWRGLSGHASLRLASAQEVRGTTTIRLWTPEDAPLAEAVQDVAYVIDAQPLRLAVGAAYQAPCWRVGAEAVVRRGADYRDLHGAATGFRNTVEVGATLRAAARRATVRAGLRYVPSPVPAQTGRTNHADADRVIAGAGVEVPLGRDLALALGLQLQRLRTTHVTKDLDQLVDEYPTSTDLGGDLIAESVGLQSNNPGLPGYTVGGWLSAAALTLTWSRS
jgi:long-chain fatty acid transport protein